MYELVNKALSDLEKIDKRKEARRITQKQHDAQSRKVIENLISRLKK